MINNLPLPEGRFCNRLFPKNSQSCGLKKLMLRDPGLEACVDSELIMRYRAHTYTKLKENSPTCASPAHLILNCIKYYLERFLFTTR